MKQHHVKTRLRKDSASPYVFAADIQTAQLRFTPINIALAYPEHKQKALISQGFL
jgi:hypothetical protein